MSDMATDEDFLLRILCW